MATRTLTTFFQAQPLETSDVVGFRVEHRLGIVTEAEIEVRHGEYVDPDELLGRPAYLAFGRGGPEHEVSGVVMDVEMEGTPEDDDERSMLYRIRVISWMGLLAREVDCRIFQDKDVKEIVGEVLRAVGVEDKHQAWRLASQYPKRTYCVQYNESSLAFVSRLLEEEGIFFHAEAGEDGETLVFSDDSTASDPIEGDEAVPYRFGAGLTGIEDAIGVITRRYRTATGKVVLRDYDFEKPKADLTATAAADAGADLEVYDYPGLYKDKGEGERLARVRLEALQCERAVVELESGCPRLTAGRWLSLVDAPDDLDGAYFITGVVHTLREGVYLARATTIPKHVKYRSPRRTPAPIIEGPQTAVVVAPEGAPAEEIHTDEHGRCKVKFHWDRYGKNDDTASCWIRVTQPQTSGAIILPRVGWEVIVEFQEGNPDRPLVTGRVFNGKWMPPYALPEGKSRTALRTSSSPGGGGTNEIRLEDKAGSEEISIRSQKNTTIATANDKKRSTAVNETKNVKVDAKLTVGAEQKIQVTNGYLNTVDGAQTASVGGNRTVEVNAVYGLTVKGDSATSVGGNQMEMDGNPIQALLALAVKAATEAAKAEAERALQQLDQAVAAKVNQVMGPVQALQGKVESLGGAMEAVSRGNLGATASVLGAAAGLPSPSTFGASLGDAMAAVAPAASGNASSALGLDTLVNGAIDAGAERLGEALGLDGGGGGGASGANMAGPDGAVAGNSGSDSATGPGHSINICSSTHDETVGGLKATIAAAGIHTTVNGARTQDVGAARVELVAGTRAETCLADKTEKALGLAVISGAPESETVGGSRTTMVGGAVVDKIGGSHTVVATSKGMFVGAFHKVDASESIVFKCGASEVVIDGGGITIKSPLVTITAPNVKEKGNVSQL
ncbi:type VI secretion system tip protein TssI/VgrG [Polyangium sp. 15x6]|uniref:type VI secretion system Vgr family protein n=1 Tax=Polyangium sp. 15x6 TaxID=3042687 RepID=UPI00249AB896|nr:type VI secretion system tip protein TssI/VgrG [Polyangium sp. 15x6]MDI3284254.1 type VI secretion system tip protein TssI/VgrG [Polyangium sp. 15x6]